MHTTVNKHKPRPWEHVINEDGYAWTVEFPNREEIADKKYSASIADTRLDHCSFECHGYHHAWANTIEELIEDIKSFHVPQYSDKAFFDELRRKDKADPRDTLQIELYWDGRGTKITRGKLSYGNMTAYTSL